MAVTNTSSGLCGLCKVATTPLVYYRPCNDAVCSRCHRNNPICPICKSNPPGSTREDGHKRNATTTGKVLEEVREIERRSTPSNATSVVRQHSSVPVQVAGQRVAGTTGVPAKSATVQLTGMTLDRSRGVDVRHLPVRPSRSQIAGEITAMFGDMLKSCALAYVGHESYKLNSPAILRSCKAPSMLVPLQEFCVAYECYHDKCLESLTIFFQAFTFLPILMSSARRSATFPFEAKQCCDIVCRMPCLIDVERRAKEKQQALVTAVVRSSATLHGPNDSQLRGIETELGALAAALYEVESTGSDDMRSKNAFLRSKRAELDQLYERVFERDLLLAEMDKMPFSDMQEFASFGLRLLNRLSFIGHFLAATRESFESAQRISGSLSPPLILSLVSPLLQAPLLLRAFENGEEQPELIQNYSYQSRFLTYQDLMREQS